MRKGKCTISAISKIGVCQSTAHTMNKRYTCLSDMSLWIKDYVQEAGEGEKEHEVGINGDKADVSSTAKLYILPF